MSSTHLSKSDSEVSSVPPSSPSPSPSGRRPAYYVQSPSRDSHDGKTTTTSFHSTPAALSPAGSPPHSHSNSSLGPHSRESSSTRYSASLKPGGGGNNNKKSGRKGGGWPGRSSWKEFDAIEEEGLLDGDGAGKGGQRRCYLVAFVAGFLVLFTFFALILWGASRPQKPSITMKSIKFNEFVVQSGSDHSGVATSMVTLNSTVKLTFRNTATFFGVHVTSSPLQITYSQLTIALGNMKRFYQSRKSQRSVTVIMEGSRIPVYGGGSELKSVNGAPTQPVPLTLTLSVHSRANVLGKLVKPMFHKKIVCSVVMDAKKMSVAVSLKDKCIYD